MKSLRFHTKYEPAELLLQRLAMAALVLRFLYRRPRLSAQPVPNGLAQYFDFGFVADPVIHTVLLAVLIVALLFYIRGKAMLPAVGFMLFFWCSKGTLIQSRGAIGHDTQVVALVLLGQFLAYLQGFACDRWNRPLKSGTDLNAHDLAVYYSQQMVAMTYFLAGASKLLRRGWWEWHSIPLVPQWAVDTVNMPIAIAQTYEKLYLNELSQPVLDRGMAIAEFLAAHPQLCRLLFSGGLLVELVAPLALLGRRSALLIGLALVGMHILIRTFMGLAVLHFEAMVLLYLVNVPMLLVAATRYFRRR